MRSRKTYRQPKPQIGESWNPEYDNTEGNFRSFARELRYYRPRGFGRLASELERCARKIEAGDTSDDWSQIGFEIEDAACELLTDWARKVERNDYIQFVREGSFAGFTINRESFEEDCDLRVDDLSDVPRGFSGLVAYVTDHGNLSGYRYSRGRSRELFAIV